MNNGFLSLVIYLVMKLVLKEMKNNKTKLQVILAEECTDCAQPRRQQMQQDNKDAVKWQQSSMLVASQQYSKMVVRHQVQQEISKTANTAKLQ